MDKKLDLYTDYLIAQNERATATGLAEILSGEISHDQCTRFLNNNKFGSKDLWLTVKNLVRQVETDQGALIIDDSVIEKAYSNNTDVISWHYDHAKNRTVLGMNLISCIICYDQVKIPVSYELITKTNISENAEGKIIRKSHTTKNQHFRSLIDQAIKCEIKFKYVLADNWFGAKDNLKHIHNLGKLFVIGIKSNRNIALSKADLNRGKLIRVDSSEIDENKIHKVFMPGVPFPVSLLKQRFKNEDGSSGVLYLISNDLSIIASTFLEIYKKRWGIEEYHKSLKQNVSVAKSPTKTATSQANHVFAAIVAFYKLESLKIKSCLNHYALKYKLILTANIAAMKELNLLKQKYQMIN